jgi:hypothetical protein
MKHRCSNSNAKQYFDYGGRGILVCEEWQRFDNFLRDMGDAPEGLSLERTDNSKGYSKDNCRWATRGEQQRNSRRNVNLTLNGSSHCISEWGRLLGLSRHTIWCRIFRQGWSVERALSTGSLVGSRLRG